MSRSVKFLLLALGCIFFYSTPRIIKASSLPEQLSGRILLQVESHGEAWYVNPDNLRRYYLGRPADAFTIMKQLSLGISNKNFNSFRGGVPAGLSGKILLKTEDFGRAYYVYPGDLKMYYLGRPADAFTIMRSLSLGITNENLSRMPIFVLPNSNFLYQLELKTHELVNQEREKGGLNGLLWNDDLASVAREHSLNLARDNEVLIYADKLCSYPFIHHEGIDFGFYHNERLHNRNIYYFSSSAENIALYPMIKKTQYLGAPSNLIDCQGQINQLNEQYEHEIENSNSQEEKTNTLEQELAFRKRLVNQSPQINILDTFWYGQGEVESNITAGWIASLGHRVNILNSEYDETGIGYAEVNDHLIATQVFIKKVDCGYKDGVCCQKVGYYPYCYQPLECINQLCK